MLTAYSQPSERCPDGESPLPPTETDSSVADGTFKVRWLVSFERHEPLAIKFRRWSPRTLQSPKKGVSSAFHCVTLENFPKPKCVCTSYWFCLYKLAALCADCSCFTSTSLSATCLKDCTQTAEHTILIDASRFYRKWFSARKDKM